MTLQDHVIKESGDFMEGNVYPDPAQIDSHRQCVNVCPIILVCHVILQKPLTTCSCDFMGRSDSK